MNKQQKNEMIDSLSQMLKENPYFYITDPAGLTVEKSNKLRRMCFDQNVKMLVVKNSLLSKAMEKSGEAYQPFQDTLKGTTAIMFSTVANAPAKIIKEFKKESDLVKLKSAFVQESVYIGHDQLDFLASIKSKDEMIGEIIGLLQSPIRNVIGALEAERKDRPAEAAATSTPAAETKSPEATPPGTPEASAAPDAPAAPETPQN